MLGFLTARIVSGTSKSMCPHRRPAVGMLVEDIRRHHLNIRGSDGRGLESLSGGQEEMERRPLAGGPPADLQQEREAVSVLLCVQQDSNILAAVLGSH